MFKLNNKRLVLLIHHDTSGELLMPKYFEIADLINIASSVNKKWTENAKLFL